MDQIFCLVGPSGSGKTTIAKTLGYNVIQSYTTRPPRSQDEWGHTFVEVMPDGADVIAYTKYNNYEYWATREQYKDKGKTIYVIDPVGVDMLKKEVSDAEIVVIFLRCDESECYKRLIERLHVETDDRLEAAIKKHGTATERLKVDRVSFSVCRADWVIDANQKLEEVLKMVKAVIDNA